MTRSSPIKDESKERLRLWIRMLKTTRTVEAELRERLRIEFGSTLPRFDVLAALARCKPGLKMSELSRMLMVSNGNVTGIVDRLAEDRLLVREAVPGDRRAALVRLTAKGVKEFKRQAGAHQEWVDELLGGLSAEESVAASSLLQTALTQQEQD